MVGFGRLEKVGLRRAWRNEAEDFAPRLAQDANLKPLGDASGMQLEREATEREARRFRADILRRDALLRCRLVDAGSAFRSGPAVGSSLAADPWLGRFTPNHAGSLV